LVAHRHVQLNGIDTHSAADEQHGSTSQGRDGSRIAERIRLAQRLEDSRVY
jgi:hypothetical protein